MYCYSTDVGRAGGSRHEYRICLVPEIWVPIRGVNVWHYRLRIEQYDDVVTEEANGVDHELIFGEQDRAGLSAS